MGSRFTELIVDSAEPARLAQFWSAVLGWLPTGRYEGAIEIAASPPNGPSMTFVPVSNPKTTKNRLHIDLNPVGCDQAQEVERLIQLGARRVDIGQGNRSWVVLADLEGNEFCVLHERVG